MAFIALEKLIYLGDGYRKVVRIGRQDLLLLHDDGCSFLIENRCPHMGRSLERADVQQGRITCPAHRFQFDLRSGQLLNASQPCAALARYQLSYEGDSIGVWC